MEAATAGLERARADGLDTVIVDTAGRIQIDEALMDELARVARRRAADERRAGARRDDRPGGGQRREDLRRADRLRRRRPDQARRRCPRRRGALGEGRHRQADHVRLDRREARRARGLPPRPDGLAHPRDGRRADPDRAGRAGRDGGRAGRDGSSVCARASSPSTTSCRPRRCSAGWARFRAC